MANIVDNIFNYFTRNQDADIIKEITLVYQEQEQVLIQERSIKAALNMISRSLEMVEWVVMNGDEREKDDLYYHLNVKPNNNQNASEFWRDIVYRLFYDNGEVLVVMSDDDQLLVADDYVKNEYALVDDVFTDVVVKNYKYQRSFVASDVLLFEKDNERIRALVTQLNNTYGRLFERLVNVAMRTNQVRGKVKIDGMMSKRQGAAETLQEYIDKIYKSYSTSDVAIVPELDGLEYTETSQDSRNVSRIDEVINVSNHYLDEVLQVLGIHPSLLYGESSKTNIDFYQRQYILNVINPITELIAREINSKFFTPEEYKQGKRVTPNVMRLQYTDAFSMANAIEKMVGSRVFSPNDVREMAGFERVDVPELDEYYLTKNIESVKGG
ncbi:MULTISPECIES: phage portal protein [Aerococcus]|nr:MULTISPECIES: phage portal protein [Aerococcus]